MASRGAERISGCRAASQDPERLLGVPSASSVACAVAGVTTVLFEGTMEQGTLCRCCFTSRKRKRSDQRESSPSTPLGSPAMALLNINMLPENILLEFFIHLPARQLLLCCRPVCSLWRDLIDLVTLWKRKCLREGFTTKEGDQPVADWKIFYFLHSLHRNLLQNPCGEEGLDSWDINDEHRWKVETFSGDYGENFPHSGVTKYFVTSYDMGLKSQLVDLKANGYWDELLDHYRPDIVVKDWFAPCGDCDGTYLFCVSLTIENLSSLAYFMPPPVTFHQGNDAKWREVSYTFSDYPPGVRYVLFQHGGRDTQSWTGWYGPRVTNSSVTVSPTRRSPNPTPKGTA